MTRPTRRPASGYTSFPAENNEYCAVATVTPLGYNWTNLTNQINAMSAYGATNQAIGFEHGWQTLTPGSPYGAPALPSNTARYIIILSATASTPRTAGGATARPKHHPGR